MMLSAPILTKALGANGAGLVVAASADARCVVPPHSNPMVSAVRLAAPAPFRNARRSILLGEGRSLLMRYALADCAAA